MSSRAAGKYLPVRWAFYFREAITDLIGREGMNAVLLAVPNPIRCPSESVPGLEKSFDFNCYAAICASVLGLYGQSGARLILARSGRTAFTRLLKGTAAMVGADHPGFHGISVAASFEARMRSIVRLLGLLSDVECACETAEDGVRFRVFSCPECAGRSAAGCLCHSMTGMAQAAADWFEAESAVTATEIHCMARGDPACEFSFAGNG